MITVTGQAVMHPEQIIHRGALIQWRGNAAYPFRTDAEGNWQVQVHSPGEYGILYFGVQKTAQTQQQHIYPQHDQAHATFQGRQPYNRPAYDAANVTVPSYPHCQPLCHGPYLIQE
ncbi:MAG: hypothetical protein H7842_10695 [Gammaproteobacteria bacterium SHHR-1]